MKVVVWYAACGALGFLSGLAGPLAVLFLVLGMFLGGTVFLFD